MLDGQRHDGVLAFEGGRDRSLSRGNACDVALVVNRRDVGGSRTPSGAGVAGLGVVAVPGAGRQRYRFVDLQPSRPPDRQAGDRDGTLEPGFDFHRQCRTLAFEDGRDRSVPHPRRRPSGCRRCRRSRRRARKNSTWPQRRTFRCRCCSGRTRSARSCRPPPVGVRRLRTPPDCGSRDPVAVAGVSTGVGPVGPDGVSSPQAGAPSTTAMLTAVATSMSADRSRLWAAPE